MLYRTRASIAIISKKWHFSSSHIYGMFTEAIFTNIEDRDKLFKFLEVSYQYVSLFCHYKPNKTGKNE